MSNIDLTHRKPVWYELSCFYLDTELDHDDLHRLANALAASPYSLSELREIELWEVAPVVYPNLFSVAGEWDGFDEAWLSAQCEKRARRRSLLLRTAMPLGFRRFIRWATKRYWEKLVPMVEEARRPSSTTPH